MKNDIAYQNADFIPGGADYPDLWRDAAQSFRETEAAVGRARLNTAYGHHDREKLDLFHPSGPAIGLAVFIHGGYWMRFDRGYWSHFAAGVTAHGWAVAMPSYPLAPEVRVTTITRSVARSVEKAASMIPGPIVVTGHSAGGHLAARLTCRDVVLAPKVRAQLRRVVPISPVSDLRPLLETSINKTLGLDPDEAEAESPILHARPDVPVSIWVGAEERPAFLDQARWLSEAWSARHRILPGRHHFDVIDALADAHSPLVSELLSE